MKMNQKILMITFHRAQSYGAFLQAYALQNCSNLRALDTEYIDYYPKRFRFLGFIMPVKGKGFVGGVIKFVPSVVCKARMHIVLQYYVKKYLKITDKTYLSPDDLKMNCPIADLFISGSDQIWDLRYDKIENVLPYYLEFTNCPRVSYASSCGEMEYYCHSQEKDYVTVLQELSKFSYVSTREAQSAVDLRLCGINNAQMMIDPTFLLTCDEWKEHIKIHKKRQKYVLVYGLYRNTKLKKYAQALAIERNIKIYNVCDMLDIIPHARNLFNITPFKLVDLIMNSSAVITDSFHGCALAINFNKELHIFEPKTSKKRIDNIVKLFGLEDRVVGMENAVINNKMEYQRINNILEQNRNKSAQYIEKCLEICDE